MNRKMKTLEDVQSRHVMHWLTNQTVTAGLNQPFIYIRPELDSACILTMIASWFLKPKTDESDRLARKTSYPFDYIWPFSHWCLCSTERLLWKAWQQAQ